MTFTSSLKKIFPAFGNPFINDAVYLKQSQPLSGTAQAQVALASLSPTLSAGRVRVKVYQFGGTSPTLLNLILNVTDGTSVVCIGQISPVVATVPGTSVTPGGTALATDGAMSATGIKVLTSATGAFTPAMVGLTIAVSTAGNAGGTIPLYSTIASYQSPTQVTLADGSVKTTAVSGATITLTTAYSNSGVKTAGSLSESGFDFIFDFCVDMNVSELDVNYTLGGTTPTAVMDVEISGTT